MQSQRGTVTGQPKVPKTRRTDVSGLRKDLDRRDRVSPASGRNGGGGGRRWAGLQGIHLGSVCHIP